MLFVEVNLDVWEIVEELMPLIEEIERIEAIAAGKESIRVDSTTLDNPDMG